MKTPPVSFNPIGTSDFRLLTSVFRLRFPRRGIWLRGTSYTITGTSQLLSVPYALYAVKAESVTGQENLDQLRQRMLNLEEIFYRQLPAPSEGLMAFYPFKGNANDFSGNGWDGTVNGATLTTDRFGKTDNAYHFTGTTNISTQFPGVTGSGDRTII